MTERHFAQEAPSVARRFRFYGKKRGDRRTGSSRLGGYGEAFFFAFFLVVGLFGGGLLVTKIILPEWAANRHFVPHECIVLGARIGLQQVDDRTFYRPEITIFYEVDEGKPALSKYQVTTYDAANLYLYSQEEAQELADVCEIGARYRCWYDPGNPSRAVLVRGYSFWTWIGLLLSIVFVAIGGVGAVRAVIQSETSTERRSALAHTARQLDLLREGHSETTSDPSLPRSDTLTDSPGTTLAYRLPQEASPGWTLASMLIACLVWNGIVAWLLVEATLAHWNGHGDWSMTLLLLPLVGGGIWLIQQAWRQWLRYSGIGPTWVEISDHPLYPGETYQLYVSQTGHLKVRRFTVVLVCEEETTFYQGTDPRTETRRVFEEMVLEKRRFEIELGVPFEAPCELTIPATAMHSFYAPHNKICWKVIVSGTTVRWPDFTRAFPLFVSPPTPSAVSA